ncbi:MAG: nucleotidyl transferase AbiEii/AbiGii toxin family protein [Pseudanabaena sp.]|jgi:predicted nucleotidyltransferase
MIDSREKQVLADLITIVRVLNLPMILVGAGARLIICNPKKFGEGRGTKDWDFAVSIDSWKSYQKLGEALIDGDPPIFQSTKTAHRFKHIETDIDVDIIPFGAIGKPKQEIIWADSGNPMSVLGFEEAISHAITTNIDDLEIQVINIPSFIVLKVFAWGDRGERTNKDLEDIEFILSKYEDDNRVYNELVEELSSGNVDFLDANIYLLGQDICRMLQDKTLIELNKLLKIMTKKFDYAEERSFGYMLKVLQKGINSINLKS